jgi:hypothetical protein
MEQGRGEELSLSMMLKLLLDNLLNFCPAFSGKD